MSSNSNRNQSSYSTFSSTSYTSYTTSSGTTARHTHADPSGTTVTDARAATGQQPTYEQTRYETGQPRIIQSGMTAGQSSLERGIGAGAGAAGGASHRIEDVTDRAGEDERESDVDRKYRAAMEDEYAKREGGA